MLDMMKVYREVTKTREAIKMLRAEDEEDWEYKIKTCGNGLALIEVYDDIGEFVGYL